MAGNGVPVGVQGTPTISTFTFRFEANGIQGGRMAE